MSGFSRMWNRIVRGKMSFKDRRRFIRLKEHHLVKYSVVDNGKGISFARNISPVGILFYCEERLRQGSTLELEINFSPHSRIVKAVAKVVRVNPLKRMGGFEIGVEFISVDEDARNFMNEKIKKIGSFRETEQKGKQQRKEH